VPIGERYRRGTPGTTVRTGGRTIVTGAATRVTTGATGGRRRDRDRHGTS